MSWFTKDGGPASKVWGLFIPEIKNLFSIVLLRFEHGSREAYHSHAFNAISWLLRGKLVEIDRFGNVRIYKPSIRPIFTPHNMCHRVSSAGTSWVISFRGPWQNSWQEILKDGRVITLTHGRKELENIESVSP